MLRGEAELPHEDKIARDDSVTDYHNAVNRFAAYTSSTVSVVRIAQPGDEA